MDGSKGSFLAVVVVAQWWWYPAGHYCIFLKRKLWKIRETQQHIISHSRSMYIYRSEWISSPEGRAV